eukprot:ANDGO_07705.mRNA.1 Palmitoyltransferase akr1
MSLMTVLTTGGSATYHGLDLITAVRSGNMPLVYMLVKQGASVNVPDATGFTALQWASLNDFVEIASFLLSNGAAVDQRSSDGESVTALMWASLKGHLSCVRLLLQWGAQLDLQDSRGFTAACHAVHYDQLFTLHYLLYRGASPLLLDKDGHSLLHWACYKGFFNIASYLLSNHHSQNNLGHGHSRSQNNSRSDNDVDHRCNQGRTALMWAAREGHKGVMALLLAHGADPKLVDNEGLDAQRHAFEKGHFNLQISKIFGSEQGRTSSSSTILGAGAANDVEKVAMLPNNNDNVGSAKALHLASEVQFQHAVKGEAGYFKRGSLTVFVLPMLAFIGIHLFHPVFAVLSFVAAMAAFGRMSVSWKNNGAGRTPVHMMWWLGSVVVCLFVHYVFVYPIASAHYPNAHSLWVILLPVMLAVYFKGSLSDPGRVLPSAEDLWMALRAVEQGLEIDHHKFCVTCLCRRPVRSKHCRFSGFCVARYDHFCVWFNTAVGFKNHRWFMIYCVSHFFVDVGMILFCYDYIMFEWGRNPTLGWGEAWFSVQPTVAYVLFYNVLVGLFTLAMSVSHISMMLNNSTSNESVDPARYTLPDGKWLYSLGWSRNWKQFWRVGRETVDWTRQLVWPPGAADPEIAGLAPPAGPLLGFPQHPQHAGSACGHDHGGHAAHAHSQQHQHHQAQIQAQQQQQQQQQQLHHQQHQQSSGGVAGNGNAQHERKGLLVDVD